MNSKVSSDRSAVVDPDYYWRPMSTCPLSKKVQLLGRGGVAVYGQWNGHEKFWLGWAPLPKIPKEMKDA